MVIDNGTVRITKVESAIKSYIVYGITFAIMGFMLEAVSIWNSFFRYENIQEIVVLVIVQIPVLLVALATKVHISALKGEMLF